LDALEDWLKLFTGILSVYTRHHSTLDGALRTYTIFLQVFPYPGRELQPYIRYRRSWYVPRPYSRCIVLSLFFSFVLLLLFTSNMLFFSLTI
jgi:hypothetical protein